MGGSICNCSTAHLPGGLCTSHYGRIFSGSLLKPIQFLSHVGEFGPLLFLFFLNGTQLVLQVLKFNMGRSVIASIILFFCSSGYPGWMSLLELTYRLEYQGFSLDMALSMIFLPKDKLLTLLCDAHSVRSAIFD